MPIDKIAYKHPYSQRQHHVEIIKIYIDDKAAHRPDNQYQETTAQDSQKPVEIDVLLIRKPLLQLAMVAPDEEEHHDESGKTINSSPTPKGCRKRYCCPSHNKWKEATQTAIPTSPPYAR